MAVANDPSDPRWASVSGREEPPSGLKDTGFAPATKPPAQFFNWLVGTLRDWVLQLAAVASGSLAWEERAWVPGPLGDAGVDALNLNVGAIQHVKLGSKLLTNLATTTLTWAHVDVADLKTGTGGESALFPNAIYYVYVGESGGGTAYNISRTAPGVGGLWKNGFIGSWRLLHIFCTDLQIGAAGGAFGGNVGMPIPHVRSGRRVRYLCDAKSQLALAAGPISTGGAIESVDVSLLVPPNSGRFVGVGLTRSSGTSAMNVQFSDTNYSGREGLRVDFEGNLKHSHVEVTCDANRVVKAKTSGDTISLSVESFELGYL